MKQAAGTPRILVAEGEPEVRAYLEIALRWTEIPTDFVEDGEEAAACLRESATKYSLLMVALRIPRKEGVEVLKKLRRVDAGLPIIVLSGGSASLPGSDALNAGADDFLTYPVSHEELKQAIHKALRIRPERDLAGDAKLPPSSKTNRIVAMSFCEPRSW